MLSNLNVIPPKIMAVAKFDNVINPADFHPNSLVSTAIVDAQGK